MEPSAGEVSQLLDRIQSGDRQAEARLFELLHRDLRRMAAVHLRKERPNHTLQPTALVNELYVRIFGGGYPAVRSRTHFLALSARVMRQLLVDHARQRGSGKRGAAAPHLSLEDVLLYDTARSAEVLAVHEALDRLQQWAPRQSRIVELRFFGGLSEEQVAEVLDVSSRTVKREWAMARAWLHAELSA
jgi:RNA polymerase sigma factor (TIGR02999 family)